LADDTGGVVVVGAFGVEDTGVVGTWGVVSSSVIKRRLNIIRLILVKPAI